ncbi:MAG: hypothetical protein ACJATN_002708 [Neolewinella sp.]|jgi:hypothetical protein
MLDLHNNRYLLSELLEPPPGFVFNYALATTYSLDLNTLLTVPLKLLRGGDADPRTAEIGLPMLQAVQEQGRQLRVFCQHGRILFPQVQHPLLCWLEEVVIQVPPPSGGSFHPKLWVVRYEERDGDGIVYRCLIGSRNLTYDQSADVMASIEGRVGRTTQTKAAPLVRFFSDLCNRYDTRGNHTTFLADLSRAAFSTNGQFADFDFLIDQADAPANWLPNLIVGGLVVSPFLTESVVEDMLKRRRYGNVPLKLVSRRNELANLSKGTLDQLEAYHLKDTTLAEFADPELTEEVELTSPAPSTSRAPAAAPPDHATVHDIHAKVYAFSTSEANHLYLGSANATHRAHNGKNVEAMLHLSGSRNLMNRYYLASAMGLDDTDSLFQRYEYQEDNKPPEDAIAKNLDEARDTLAAHLQKSGRISGTLKEDSKYHQLSLSVDLTSCPPPPAGITAFVTYLYRPDAPMALHYGEANVVRIERLNITEVSRWLVFEVKHTASKTRQRFLLLADYPIPEDRNDLILSGMFHNRAAFFGYLHLLLNDQEGTDWSENDGQETGILSSSQGGWSTASVPLYEDLARQLALAPEKLARVDDFIRLMERDDRINELELQDFLALWRVFRTATLQIPSQ